MMFRKPKNGLFEMNDRQQKPTTSLIAIALMVKNEATSINSTLASLSQAGIRDFLILDTGSTDNTIALAETFFREHQLNGCIKQEPFIDFSTSRNRTLELAEHQFPESLFLLMPDAEWSLHNAQSLVTFCEQERTRDTAVYLLTIKMNTMEFSTARLFRNKKHIRFKGVVHEVPDVIAQIKVPSPVFFEVNASQRGIEKSAQRWKQDLILLSKEFELNPQDPRNTFYLAQTYECLGDLENAYRFYQHREKLLGWDEENYITLLRLGDLATRIKQTTPLLQWATAMDYYLKAYACRPHRIEPLVKIADHYWPDNAQTCYLFIRQAYTMPYPKNDLLFVDKESYMYHRYEIMSRCAWYVGEFVLGEQATLLALKAHPEAEHLHRNLTLYQDKLKKEIMPT